MRLFPTLTSIRRALVIGLLGLLFVISFLFASKNDAMVQLKFILGWAWSAPLSVVMVLSLLFGIVVGIAFGGVTVYRMMNNKLKKEKLKNAKKVEHSPVTPLPNATGTMAMGSINNSVMAP